MPFRVQFCFHLCSILHSVRLYNSALSSLLKASATARVGFETARAGLLSSDEVCGLTTLRVISKACQRGCCALGLQ